MVAYSYPNIVGVLLSIVQEPDRGGLCANAMIENAAMASIVP
jgi:hypothetical protein